MHKTSGQRDPAVAFPLPVRRDDREERRLANRAIAVSAAGLAATGLAELLIAVLTGSVGLLGDAIHNLSDVSTSVVVFLGFRLSRRGPTERYPYGLDRAEDLAGVGIALVIWASAAFAGYESIRKLLAHGSTSHAALGICGAALGIVGNQVVARYKLVDELVPGDDLIPDDAQGRAEDAQRGMTGGAMRQELTDALVPGERRAGPDDQRNPDPGQILGPVQAVGIPLSRPSPRQAEPRKATALVETSDRLWI